jgi:hypothetical protein
MVVLCIGDGHLRHGDRRNAVRLRALDQIVSRARALRATDNLAAIVWPGDLFHAESGIEDRNILAGYVQQFAELAPLVIVRGNHDRPGDLDIFERFAADHPVHVVTSPQVVVLTRPQRLAIACVPYPEKGALLLADVGADLAGAVHRAFDALFLELGMQLDGHEAQGIPTMFAGHLTIGGAELSVGQPLVGQDLQVDATHLAKLPAATVRVLNHIHKPQEIHGAHYIGSIAPVDYGEVERKRFLELTLGVDGAWRVVSVPLDVPPMYHVEGVATRDRFDWVVKKGPDGAVTTAPLSWAGADVRVRYRFASADAGLLDATKAQILATFAEAAHLELEPVAVVEREVRAPKVVAATTLVDKLRAWSDAQGLPASDGVLEKLAALEQADADALLARLQARLTRPQTPAVAA